VTSNTLMTSWHNHKRSRNELSLEQPHRCARKRRSGAALLLVLFVVTFTSAMVIGMLDSETVDMAIQRNTADYERAFYLASAGVSHGLAELEENMMWRTGVVGVEFPTGSGNTYSVAVTDGTGNQVIVTGSGIANGVTRTVQVTVEPGI
jgi:Tfp pilus assembly protein PilX